MKAMKKMPLSLLVLAVAVAFAAGCGKAKEKKKEITSLQRKEAATLASEAQFAVQLRDHARAEGLLAKAVELCPDDGIYWVNLGSARIRLGNKSGAKDAYVGAEKALRDAAEEKKTDAEPWLQRVYVLALLGRADEARSVLKEAAQKFPDNRNVRAFVDGQFDRMLADPKFKELAI